MTIKLSLKTIVWTTIFNESLLYFNKKVEVYPCSLKFIEYQKR
jgi:hypothetical protein